MISYKVIFFLHRRRYLHVIQAKWPANTVLCEQKSVQAVRFWLDETHGARLVEDFNIYSTFCSPGNSQNFLSFVFLFLLYIKLTS